MKCRLIIALAVIVVFVCSAGVLAGPTKPQDHGDPDVGVPAKRVSNVDVSHISDTEETTVVIDAGIYKNAVVRREQRGNLSSSEAGLPATFEEKNDRK